jgi:hypothetical protein
MESHRDSRPPGAGKSMSLDFFCWFLNQVLFEFLKKKKFGQILVEQRKIEVLLKNSAIFQKKKSPKSGRSSGFFKYFVFNLG